MLPRHRHLLALPLLVVLASGPAAEAAGPGETFLVSGRPGLAPPTPADFAFNRSAPGQDYGDAVDITPNGRWIAFTSLADGLAPTVEDRRHSLVLVKDRLTGILTAVTSGADGEAVTPSISDDGTKVAFETNATNLVPGDGSRDPDVVVRDLATGTSSLVTGPAVVTLDTDCRVDCFNPQLSGDGSAVSLETNAPLVAGDANAERDVYVAPAGGGAPQLVSRTPAGKAGNGLSFDASISADGDVIAFTTEASNVVAGDTNGERDVVVANVASGAAVIASAVTASTTGGNGQAGQPQLSANGFEVAFTSTSANLGDGDTDTGIDVHLRQVVRGAVPAGDTALVSRMPNGAKANDGSFGPRMSADGSHVAFLTEATNAPAGAGVAFIRDVDAGTTAALGAGPFARTLSLDGTGAHRVVEEAGIAGLEPGLVVTGPGMAAVVSRPSDGRPLVPVLGNVGDTDSGDAYTSSADGRYVVFASGSPALPGSRLSTEDRGEAAMQVYRRDNRTGDVRLISQGPDGASVPARATNPSISADGNRVAFLTGAALSPGDGDYAKAYVRDVAAQTTTLVSRPSGVTAGPSVVGHVEQAQISGNGERVLFTTDAAGLGAVDGDTHAYVRDLGPATTTRVDRKDGAAGAGADGTVFGASMSADGTRVAFASNAPNLGAGGSGLQIRLRDLQAQTTTLVSRASGPAGVPGTGLSANPVISADGTHVAFTTQAVNLDPSAAPWPSGVDSQVVVRDVTTATTTLVSRDGPSGPAADDKASEPALSGDGRLVAYTSEAGNLGNASGVSAVFVRDLASGTQTAVGPTGPADSQPYPDRQGAAAPGFSADGACLRFSARGVGLLDGVSPDYRQVYVRVLAGDCGTPPPAGPAGPGGGQPGGQPDGGPIPGTTAPVRLSAVSLSRTTFRVGAKRTATTAARPRRTPAGTRIRFTLDGRASVAAAMQRRTIGRRSGGACRKVTKRLRSGKRCVRWVAEGTLRRAGLGQGRHAIPFSGRVGKRKLAPGRHRVALVATDTAGRRSTGVARGFRVVRR